MPIDQGAIIANRVIRSLSDDAYQALYSTVMSEIEKNGKNLQNSLKASAAQFGIHPINLERGLVFARKHLANTSLAVDAALTSFGRPKAERILADKTKIESFSGEIAQKFLGREWTFVGQELMARSMVLGKKYGAKPEIQRSLVAGAVLRLCTTHPDFNKSQLVL